MKPPVFGVCAACLLILFTSGCQISPHTTERFHAVEGHVVDATTAQPLAHATITIHAHPSTKARTDKDGYFCLREQRNHHWGYTLVVVAEDAPQGKNWPYIIDVAHPGYESQQINAGQIVQTNVSDKYQTYVLRDIALIPKP